MGSSWLSYWHMGTIHLFLPTAFEREDLQAPDTAVFLTAAAAAAIAAQATRPPFTGGSGTGEAVRR